MKVVVKQYYAKSFIPQCACPSCSTCGPVPNNRTLVFKLTVESSSNTKPPWAVHTVHLGPVQTSSCPGLSSPCWCHIHSSWTLCGLGFLQHHLLLNSCPYPNSLYPQLCVKWISARPCTHTHTQLHGHSWCTRRTHTPACRKPIGHSCWAHGPTLWTSSVTTEWTLINWLWKYMATEIIHIKTNVSKYQTSFIKDTLLQ